MSQKLKGSLIDNYVLTYYSDFVKDNDVRIETTFEHAITYGLSVRANESSDMLNCFRRYVRNHPQEVFEIIAKYLEPLKVRRHMEFFILNWRTWPLLISSVTQINLYHVIIGLFSSVHIVRDWLSLKLFIQKWKVLSRGNSGRLQPVDLAKRTSKFRLTE